MSHRPPFLSLVIFTLGGILLIVIAESLIPRSGTPLVVDKPAQDQNCQGTPIYVTYPYQGGMLDPWECKVQCDDKKQRYIVYTNGKATPCEVLPGCLDYGEDYDITCTPPKDLAPKTIVAPAKK